MPPPVQPDPVNAAGSPAPGSAFPLTHWSAVIVAGHPCSPGAEAALAELCRTYWYPLYAYLRRKGHSQHDAEDLTQEFFAQRVATGAIFRGVSPVGGKFRTWLLNSLQNLVRNQIDKREAKKRGGGQVHVSIDFLEAEGRYGAESMTNKAPETQYERDWAVTLVEQALEELRSHYEQAGKAEFFAAMKCYLPGATSQPSYAVTAARLGKTEDSVKMAASRLRRQYGETLTVAIRRTVSHPDEVQEEFRHLMAALGA